MAGIIIHELCHLLMCIVTNTPVEEIKLLERVKMIDPKGENRYAYGGRIMLRNNQELTFLQALLTGLAPLVFSFWLFFIILEYLFSVPDIEVLYFFLLIFLMFSIILAAAPSALDLFNIPAAFQNNLRYSLYQLGLLLLSILFTWLLSFTMSLQGYYELLYYLLIGIFYYGLKYGIKGIKRMARSPSRILYKHPLDKYRKHRIENIEQYYKR